MSKADEWLRVQTENHNNTSRWVSEGAFGASAELCYLGPGWAALVKLNSETGSMMLAPVDALSLGKWLMEMYSE